MDFTQPDGQTTFRGTFSDSEIAYSWLNVTEDGYVFIEGLGDWYCYAELGFNGDYIPSQYIVGFDDPEAAGIPKGLERTGYALQTYQTQLDSFNRACEEQNQTYLSDQMGDLEEFFQAVLCVKFGNVGPNNTTCYPNQNPRYTKEHFQQALESFGTYHTDLYGTTSPDGDPVYGSFKDYFYEVSRWNAMTETEVVNPVVNDTLQWLEYPGYVDYTTSHNYAQNQWVWDWAVDYADSLGWLPPNTKYVVIVGAGTEWQWVDGLGWHVVAPVGGLGLMGASYSNPVSGLDIDGGYTVHERWDWWGSWYQNPSLHERYFNQVNPPHEYKFTGIGLWCHEAGHGIFGWGHWPQKTHTWNLMISGTCAGPGYACSCPSHPMATQIVQMGWVEPIEIINNQIGLSIGYDSQFSTLSSPYGTPQLFVIEGTQLNNPYQDVYFTENRWYGGFNKFCPGNPNEPENYPIPNPLNNLLITHNAVWPPGMGGSHLENGNDVLGRSTQPEGCPFPGSTGRNHLLPSYEDTAVFDTRNIVVLYNTQYDGAFQEGVAFKNIVSDPTSPAIIADVYCNYWAGTLDDAPGGSTTAWPDSMINWSGEDIVVGGDIIVADYQTLNIAASSVLTPEDNPCITSNGLTVFEAAQINADLTLKGNFQINQELTINEGATLTIIPDPSVPTGGTIFEFATGSYLQVNGNLIAEGGPGEDVIHFKRLNDDQIWEGIIIDNQSVMFPGNSSLDFCNVTGANVGLKTVRANNLQITDCNLAGNTVGAYYIHCNATGNPSFRDNNINTNEYGLVIFGGGFGHDVEVLQNNFYDNTEIGLFMHSGNSYPIGGNLITGSKIGVLCRNYTHSNLSYHELTHELGGYNTITGNDYGLKILDGSTPYLGDITYGFYGKNNITNFERLALWNTNPHILIKAEDNWWQANPPDTTATFFQTSMVDYDPWSTSPNYQTDNISENIGSAVEHGEDLWQYIVQAMGYVYSGQPEEAIPIYEQILTSHANTPQAAQALEGIYWASAQLYKPPELQVQIGGLDFDLPRELVELEDYLEIQVYLNADNPEIAFTKAQNLAASARQKNIRLLSQFSLGVIQKYHMNQPVTGNEYFAEFVQLYPRNELTGIAQIELGVAPTAEIFGNETAQTLTAIPETFALYQNYPNPFNPLTTISYDLPQTTNVNIVVNNVRGEAVAVLVNGMRTVGSHQVTWEAGYLASGVYLCTITTQDGFSKTIKMIVLK